MGSEWGSSKRPLQGPGAGRASRMPGQTSGGKNKGCWETLFGLMAVLALCLAFLADCTW